MLSVMKSSVIGSRLVRSMTNSFVSRNWMRLSSVLRTSSLKSRTSKPIPTSKVSRLRPKVPNVRIFVLVPLLMRLFVKLRINFVMISNSMFRRVPLLMPRDVGLPKMKNGPSRLPTILMIGLRIRLSIVLVHGLIMILRKTLSIGISITEVRISLGRIASVRVRISGVPVSLPFWESLCIC